MFREVKDLNRIEIFCNKSCKIFSMISTFENCANLEDFRISGFDLDDLKSMKNL